MTTLTANRKNHGLANALLFIVGITFLVTWLPLLRSLFDGQSYQWGLSYFGYFLGGKGVTPAYLFLVIQLLFYGVLFMSFYWIKNRIVHYVLMGIWWVHIFGNLLFDIYTSGDTEFHGETMNVHVSLSAIVIPLSLVTILLMILTIRKDMHAGNVMISWSRRNTMLALIILGPLPIQAILLASGEPHGITDQIGVLISIAQCLAIPFIVRPYNQNQKNDVSFATMMAVDK